MNLETFSEEVIPELQKVLPTAEQMPRIHYDQKTADQRGYKEIGQFYSCVPDSVYPWDPEMMKLIWEFAPDAVPMWVQWAFMTPSDTGRPTVQVFGRHALGRVIENAANTPIGFPCLMPTMPVQGLTFKRPNTIWFVHDGLRRDEKYKDLPGSYLPFDGSIVDRAKKCAVGFNMTEKEFIEFMLNEHVEKPRLERERRKKFIDEELAARQRDFEKYARKQVANISDVELDEYMRSVGLR